MGYNCRGYISIYILTKLAKNIQTVLGATADQLANATGFIKR